MEGLTSEVFIMWDLFIAVFFGLFILAIFGVAFSFEKTSDKIGLGLIGLMFVIMLLYIFLKYA